MKLPKSYLYQFNICFIENDRTKINPIDDKPQLVKLKTMSRRDTSFAVSGDINDLGHHCFEQ